MGTAVQAATALAAQIFLMRQLMPHDFGQFAIVLASCGLVQTIVSLRLNILIIRLQTDDLSSHQAQLYQAALIWETLAAVVIALIWLAISDLISIPSLILLTALTIGQWINQISAFYERGMDYGRITLVETGSQLFGHVAALILVLSGMGAISLYMRELVAVCGKLAAYTAIGALPRPVWMWPRFQACREIWRETRGVWVEGILEGIFTRIVILSSGALTGLHGAGLFAQSQRLAMLPHQFLSPVVSRMSANLFNRTTDFDRRQYLAIRLGALTLALMLPAIAFIWLWGGDIVPWLFGDKWRSAAFVLRAMIGVILFLSLFELLRAFCYAHRWVRPVLWARTSQIAVFIVPVLLLQPQEVANLAWILSASFTAGFIVLAGHIVSLIRRNKANV
uniref:GumJ protein n=1 Tax=Magnetospirillum gryphiswaldense TaxID=55518 RepID=A4U199_9PROT|nr:GumJ protein [Magnetospirillum gryphiswaldense MSR-1]